MVAFEKLMRELEAVFNEDVDYSKDYFALIKEVLASEEAAGTLRHELLQKLYTKIRLQILKNDGEPVSLVKFGTSGWRGILGRDLYRKSVAQVTMAIIDMYRSLADDTTLAGLLGVSTLAEAQKRGCVIGFDNRFCGELLASVSAHILKEDGFTVHYAGESTTGVLSATVLQLNAAFSINFTPSHNPLEYGGLKYNAADGGPAAEELTTFITGRAQKIIADGMVPAGFNAEDETSLQAADFLEIDSFSLWEKQVLENVANHGVDYRGVVDRLRKRDDISLVVDSVHGASRLHISRMFPGCDGQKLVHLRSDADVTFGGVAPEPSSVNMKNAVSVLVEKETPFNLCAIIDPDGDRIRFSDGVAEISMNQFGAMAFHFLHTYKGKRGLIAKTVATSNLGNSVAKALGAEIFESKVGFKEFKPVIGKALVCFEESDGISIIGHTPEKDAYIGLILALDMMMTTGKNLSEYLLDIEEEFGYFYPERDGIVVKKQGRELQEALDRLEHYRPGALVIVAGEEKKITEVITIDGRKMIFEDGSWLMVRPSGTEPKIRFYVESRTSEGAADLVESALGMLREINVL